MISVVIPAHNESSVIARTLREMTNLAAPGELDVIVVCNGCSDDTANIVRSFGSPVRAIETEISNKIHALNLGDRAAYTFPRVYADADVVLTLDALRTLSRRLESGDVLAVAPLPYVDLTGCSNLVRAFFAIASKLPSAVEGIGGSGVYALSEVGRSRFIEFPRLIADDGYVRMLFSPEERETVRSVNSIVFAPRTIKDLIATRIRAHYGNLELARLFPQLCKNKGESNYKSLVKLFRYPSLWPELLIYCYVSILARLQAKIRLRDNTLVWVRDNTSREPPD